MRLLPLLLLTACATNSYPPELPLEARLTECSDDADCVVVELGCCDACNGGFAVAVNRDSAAEVEEQFSEGRCNTRDCTLMDCGAAQVGCDAGTCTWEYGDAF